MHSHRLQYAAEKGSRLEGAMCGYGDVMDTVVRCREADMRARLPHPFIAKHAQSADEIGSVDVAWNFQTASASSRTKCRRIIFGAGPAVPSPK